MDSNLCWPTTPECAAWGVVDIPCGMCPFEENWLSFSQVLSITNILSCLALLGIQTQVLMFAEQALLPTELAFYLAPIIIFWDRFLFCSSGQPWTQLSSCLSLLSTGITGVYHCTQFSWSSIWKAETLLYIVVLVWTPSVQKAEDHEAKASLGYRVRFCFKITKCKSL